jgi:hypothetical protein
MVRGLIMVLMVLSIGLLCIPLLMLLSIYEDYVDSGRAERDRMLRRSKRRVRAMERRKRKGKRTPLELEADIKVLEIKAGMLP